MASLVREISQARLVTLRKKRSGLTMSLSAQEDGKIQDLNVTLTLLLLDYFYQERPCNVIYKELFG